MKKNFLLYALLLLVTAVQAQTPILHITTGKTTTLVFPSTIRHVDRGRPELLVQQVRESGNLLMLKAATAGFPETNLSVVTGDGKLYSFLVRYDSLPEKLVYELEPRVQFTNQGMNETELLAYMLQLLDNDRHSRGIQDRAGGLQWQVNGIYTYGYVVFLHLAMENASPIDYHLDYLRIYTRDARQGKRTAMQEKEMAALKILGPYKKVAAGCSVPFIIALPRFALSARQFLALEAGEAAGGRRLQLKIRRPHLMRARILPAFNTDFFQL